MFTYAVDRGLVGIWMIWYIYIVYVGGNINPFFRAKPIIIKMVKGRKGGWGWFYEVKRYNNNNNKGLNLIFCFYIETEIEDR